MAGTRLSQSSFVYRLSDEVNEALSSHSLQLTSEDVEAVRISTSKLSKPIPVTDLDESSFDASEQVTPSPALNPVPEENHPNQLSEASNVSPPYSNSPMVIFNNNYLHPIPKPDRTFRSSVPSDRRISCDLENNRIEDKIPTLEISPGARIDIDTQNLAQNSAPNQPRSQNIRDERLRLGSVQSVNSKNIAMVEPVARTTESGFMKAEEKPEQNSLQLDGCGFWQCRPEFLKTLANPKCYLLLFSLLCFSQGMLVNGLINVNVSTIERRFQLSSTQMGIICGAYDFFCIFIGIPLAYFGGRGNKPVVISFSALALVIGSFLFCLPHFLTDSYQYDYKEVRPDTCHYGLGSDCDNDVSGNDSNAYLKNFFFVFLLSQVMNAIGGSLIYTVGTAYMTDCVSSSQSSVYIGIAFGIGGMGPSAGFLVGGHFLEYFVDIDKPEAMNELMDLSGEFKMSSMDPRWCGAWWAGFLVSMLVSLIIAFPFSAFPQSMRKQKEEENSFDAGVKSEMSDAKGAISRTSTPLQIELNDNLFLDKNVDAQNNEYLTIKKTPPFTAAQNRPLEVSAIGQAQRCFGTPRVCELPVSIVTPFVSSSMKQNLEISIGGASCCQLYQLRVAIESLLTNPTFMCVALSLACDLFLLNGFAAFMPKFIQHQFSLSASYSAMLMGGTLIVAITLGSFGGGISARCQKLKIDGLLVQNITCGFFCCWLLAILWARCDVTPLDGMTHGPNSDIVNSCNAGCSCPSQFYTPVCDPVEKVQYFSACHAGCQTETRQMEDLTLIIYEHCNCLGRNVSTSVVAGPCKVPVCNWLWVAIIGLFFFLFFHSCCTVPSQFIVMQCLSNELKSVALATYRAIGFLLGSIIGPVVFGLVIDSICLLWETSECDSDLKGSCWVYDNHKLSMALFILGLVAKVLSVYFQTVALVYRIYKRAKLTGVTDIGDLTLN